MPWLAVLANGIHTIRGEACRGANSVAGCGGLGESMPSIFGEMPDKPQSCVETLAFEPRPRTRVAETPEVCDSGRPQGNEQCRARPFLANPGRGAVWLARLTGGQEVAGSSPVAPTGLLEPIIRLVRYLPMVGRAFGKRPVMG